MGGAPAQIIKASQTHQYDYYFLTSIDVPWEKDNLRDRPNDRDKMFRIFEQQLIKTTLLTLFWKDQNKSV